MSSRSALLSAFGHARQLGWSVCNVALEDALEVVSEGGAVVPTRRGEPPMGLVQARRTEEAHPLSLSATYGVGAFPLHTDGAHLRPPPDYTLLAPVTATDAPTLLFDVPTSQLPVRAIEAFRRGVFAVGGGSPGFYATAIDSEGSIRYDPGCMFPIDPDARWVRTLLEEAAASASQHQWVEGATLVIANRRCLHGRPDVAGNPGRVLRRLMVHWGDG